MIGGGYIGCELAQMFARAGVAVTLLFRSRLLPEAEPEISEALAGYLAEDGIAVRKVRDYRKVGMTDGGVALSVQDEDGDETLDAERLLLSIGRKPNTRGLGLRSEEHTSELQSLMRISYAVFCLKKKKNNTSKTV